MTEAFQGEYRWLSNFWPCRVVYEGVEYPTTEHAYQAAKFDRVEHRAAILACATPGQAKRVSRKYPTRSGWDAIKLDIMADLQRQKYENTRLREKLLATGDEVIQEGNTWGDTFWGVCYGKGNNHLGQILMALRESLRDDR